VHDFFRGEAGDRDGLEGVFEAGFGGIPIAAEGVVEVEIDAAKRDRVRMLCSAWNTIMKLKVPEIPKGIPSEKEP
jgi:hypothetical protein